MIRGYLRTSRPVEKIAPKCFPVLPTRLTGDPGVVSAAKQNLPAGQSGLWG